VKFRGLNGGGIDQSTPLVPGVILQIDVNPESHETVPPTFATPPYDVFVIVTVLLTQIVSFGDIEKSAVGFSEILAAVMIEPVESQTFFAYAKS
jgi:hypothetical protein